jgi:hypothetical protein
MRAFVGAITVHTHYYYLLFSLALQPSAGYGLLQPSVGYGHLWLCSLAWAMASSSRFFITQYDAPQLVGLLWMSDQLVAETST